MSPNNVLSLWGEPETETVRPAAARCVSLIMRRYAVSMAEIAKAVRCHPNTIENAYNANTTLSLEIFSRLQFTFDDPKCWEPWDRLVRPWNSRKPTTDERFAQIERDLGEIRKEIAR